MYAYGIYRIHHKPITYIDIFINEDVILEVIYFEFATEHILKLRKQICEMNDNLAIL